MEKDVENNIVRWERHEAVLLGDLGSEFPLSDESIITGLYSAVSTRLARAHEDHSNASNYVGRQRDAFLHGNKRIVSVLEETQKELAQLLPEISDSELGKFFEKDD